MDPPADEALQKGEIGRLEPDVAKDVVAFGMKLDGIRIDLRLMAMRRMDNLPVPQKIEVLERDLALWMK